MHLLYIIEQYRLFETFIPYCTTHFYILYIIHFAHVLEDLEVIKNNSVQGKNIIVTSICAANGSMKDYTHIEL